MVRQRFAPTCGPPGPDVPHPVLTEAIHDGAAALRQGPAHFLVPRLQVGVRVDPPGAAPVVLEVVDPPFRIGLRVLLLMAVTARVAAAGHRPGRGVDAQFQSPAVHVIRERLHVGKLGIGNDVAVGIASAFPGVVDVDEDVARRGHAVAHHRVRGFTHDGVVDLVTEMVPAVPAHRRSPRESVGGNGFHRGQGNRGRRIGFRLVHANGRSLFVVLSSVGERDPEFIALRVEAVRRAPIDAEGGVGPVQARLSQGKIGRTVDDHLAVERGAVLVEDQKSVQRDAARPRQVNSPGAVKNRGLGGNKQEPEGGSNESFSHGCIRDGFSGFVRMSSGTLARGNRLAG